MSSFECANHPGADAAFLCVGCEGLFCGDCVVPKKFGRESVDTCKGCGELCRPVQGAITVQERGVGEALGSAFAYPLREAGPLIILGGTLFATAIELFASGLGTLIAWGIFLGYGMTIIQSTASGQEDAPNWPDHSGPSDIVGPMILACATAAISFYPAGWAFTSGRIGLGWALLAAGTLYAPMAWIAASISRNFLAITPITVLPLLFKVNASYWLACGVLLGVSAVGLLGMAGLGLALPAFLRGALTNAAAFYLLMVEMRILGLVWRGNADELGLA